MKKYKIIIILLNLTLVFTAYYESSVSSGSGFQDTTCDGPCCKTGQCVITTPQQCTDASSSWQGTYFGSCNTTFCEPYTVITPIAGCTLIANGTATTWWGYKSIANVNLFIPQGIYSEFINVFSVPLATITTFYPYVLF